MEPLERKKNYNSPNQDIELKPEELAT